MAFSILINLKHVHDILIMYAEVYFILNFLCDFRKCRSFKGLVLYFVAKISHSIRLGTKNRD